MCKAEDTKSKSKRGRQNWAKNNHDADREFEVLAKILQILTKESVENDTDMAYIVFRHAYRSVEYLKHTKLSASVKAYDKFKEMTGKDIRNFNWYDKMPRDKKNNIIRNSKKYPAFIHQLFQWEHKTTAYQFKEELEAEYKKHKKITTEFIKNLMKKQEMCWITKEENQRLNKKWSKERPQNAYGLLKPPIEIETKPIEIEK